MKLLTVTTALLVASLVGFRAQGADLKDFTGKFTSDKCGTRIYITKAYDKEYQRKILSIWQYTNSESVYEEIPLGEGELIYKVIDKNQRIRWEQRLEGNKLVSTTISSAIPKKASTTYIIRSMMILNEDNSVIYSTHEFQKSKWKKLTQCKMVRSN